MYGDGKEYECGTGSTMGPGGLVQAIQGPYESGTELFARIFQLMKFPRHATVCKSIVKKNNGWIKTEVSPPSTPKATSGADARGGRAWNLPPSVSSFLSVFSPLAFGT